jgi:hypothetical protein
MTSQFQFKTTALPAKLGLGWSFELKEIENNDRNKRKFLEVNKNTKALTK